jgi:hypothetical protein
LRAALEGHLRAEIQTRRHETLREVSSVQKNLLQSIAKSQLNTFSDELRILPAKDITGLFPIVICSQDQVTGYSYYFDNLFVVSDEGHDYKAYAAQSKRCVMLTQASPKFVPDQWTMVSLNISPFTQVFDWRSVSTSDRLPFLETLASQFSPFLHEMRVYNARGIQIFSFLGDRLDMSLMQRLGMPYKEIGEGGLSTKLIVESFLDRRKPVILLLRDHKFGQTFTGYLPWHLQIIEKLTGCGVHICNLWSVNLKNAPAETMEHLYENVRRFAEESNASSAPGMTESPTLDHHARPESHAMEPVSQNPRTGSTGADF